GDARLRRSGRARPRLRRASLRRTADRRAAARRRSLRRKRRVPHVCPCGADLCRADRLRARRDRRARWLRLLRPDTSGEVAMRICSLLPSATEIVASLGLVESLVAVSEECDWPREVRALPVVSASRVDTTRLSSFDIDRAVRAAVGDGRPLYAIDRELREALEPDLILAPEPLRGLRRLRRERRRALRHRGRGRRPRRGRARGD